MIYPDTVKLALTQSDGYGDKHVEVLAEVAAVFIQRVGEDHNNSMDYDSSLAIVYLNPEDPTVIANSYRLEGMYIIAQPFGQSQDESWYQIMTCNVGQHKLLNNEIDNIHCQLRKVGGLPYVR